MINKPSVAQERFLERMRKGELLENLVTTDEDHLYDGEDEHIFSITLGNRHVDGLSSAVIRSMKKKHLIEEQKRYQVTTDLWRVEWKVKA